MASYPEFETFVRRASPRLLGAARLIVGDAGSAEDLTQETLVRVYRAWPSIRELDAADAYAYRTLLRLGHRLQRSNRRRDLLRLRFEGSDQGTAGPAEVEGWEDFRFVRECLKRLPDRQRQTLALRFYADLSVETTANIMSCSPGTVKSQTAKGLNALRILLGSVSAPSSKGSA